MNYFLRKVLNTYNNITLSRHQGMQLVLEWSIYFQTEFVKVDTTDSGYCIERL